MSAWDSGMGMRSAARCTSVSWCMRWSSGHLHPSSRTDRPSSEAARHCRSHSEPDAAGEGNLEVWCPARVSSETCFATRTCYMGGRYERKWICRNQKIENVYLSLPRFLTRCGRRQIDPEPLKLDVDALRGLVRLRVSCMISMREGAGKMRRPALFAKQVTFKSTSHLRSNTLGRTMYFKKDNPTRRPKKPASRN